MTKLYSPVLKTSLIALSLSILFACGQKSTEDQLAEAQQYLSEKNASAAIVTLKNAVQNDPRSATVRYELGKVYLDTMQYESAEKELNRALEYGYDAARVLPLLTQAYQKTGAYVALSKINDEQAGLTAVERAEIGYFKVLSLVRLEKYDDAKLLIDELAKIDTSSIYKPLTAAYALVIDKKFKEAAEQVAELRKVSPQNPELLKLLAQLQLSINQPQEAAAIFEEYLQFYPDDAQITFVVGKLLVDLGKTEEAEPYLDKLLKINKLNPLLNQLKAAARAAAKDFSEALKYSEIAITNGSTDPGLRLIAGYSAYQIADYSGANRHLSFVASQLPDNHPGLKLLAASQLQLGLTTEAGEVLARLDELTTLDAPLLSKASYQLLREGYQNDAAQLVERTDSISSTAEDLTRLGLLKLSLNNLDGIVNLQEAVAKAPELESAQTTLATAYVATGQFDKALELANQWKESDPNSLKAYMLAGEVWLKRQDFVKARQEFEQGVALDSKNPAPKMALINLELMNKNLANARQQLDTVLLESPDYLPALATNYLLQRQQGDASKALAQIKQQQQKSPNNMGLKLLLARSYLAEKNYTEAVAVIDKGVDDPSTLPPAYWRVKGQALIASNLRSEAEKHYDSWLGNFPNDKDATLGKMLLLDSQNKFSEGAVLARQFLSNRNDSQMQLMLVHFLIMSNDLTAAKTAYDALPANALNLPMAKGFLARFQLGDKDYVKALDNAQLAYQASPNYRNAMLLVFIYDNLKQQAKSLAFLEQHMANHPDDLASRMVLAERQIGQDKAMAIQSYETALAQNPKNYIALNNLAYLEMQNGQLAKAKDYAEKALELKPDDVATLDTMAQVLVAQKDYDKALKYYERAVTDSMQIEEVYLNYVEALFAAKQDVLAKRKLEQRTMTEQASLERVAALKAKYNIP
jgi:cellulose synthase operon protein C